MAIENTALIDVDWDRFDPWRIQTVSHRLADHPLLQLPSLVQLGKRLEANGRIRTHNSEATAGTPFNDAPGLHPNARGAEATLGDIEHASAWMSLLNVQTDAEYRRLIDSVLEPIRPRIESVDPDMTYRAGWIFISSPGAVTPFHMDKEHNFILQIHGRKRLYVWEHDDVDVVSEAARDRFHQNHSRDLIQWREAFRERARVFDLEPGMGAYMPSTSPHMVENGEGPSITMSFTYYTASTRRKALLHRIHEIARARGVNPPPVGRYPWLDAATSLAAFSVHRTRSALRRLAGRRTSPWDTVPYAIPKGG